MWNGTVTIAEKNITYIGTVHSDYLSYADWTAGVYDIQTDSSGHYTSWKIMVNTRYSIEEETLAHEFGHAIGLYDLYEAKNKDKIMYGYRVGRTATRPTTLDKWGAKVITGAHSSHTWKYKYHSFNSFGNIHVRYCSSCQGLYNSSPNPAPCTYNSSNVCTLCGIPKGVQPSSVVVPASAKLLKIY